MYKDIIEESWVYQENIKKGLEEGHRLRGVAVPHDDLVARIEKPPRNPAAHRAETDDGDSAHDSACGLRLASIATALRVQNPRFRKEAR